MRRHLAAVTLAAMLAMPVSANEWWMPSPISVALTVGQWLVKDRQQVFYLQVRAQGRDEKHARDQAFRLAVEQAIGALVLAETEVRRGNVDRNDIISYSSGFVHDFRILERREVNGAQEIVVDVWVTRSHLADRLLSTSRTDAVVEGSRVSQQIQSFQHSRDQGDRVLTTVLADFPRRAFDIKLGRTQVLVNEYRQPVLSIWMDITWSQTYLKSLDEAVSRISHAPHCDSWVARQSNECRAKGRAKVLNHTGFFDDQIVGNLLHNHMGIDPPRLYLRVLDRNGTVVYTDCITPLGIDPYEHYSHYFYQVSGRGLGVDPHAKRSGDVRIDLARLNPRDLDRLEAEMVRRSQCPAPQ
jgi:hypothetical protein